MNCWQTHADTGVDGTDHADNPLVVQCSNSVCNHRNKGHANKREGSPFMGEVVGESEREKEDVHR